jgi:uncharacterized protein (DUF1697 family)
VSMKSVKTSFERLGFNDVRTYINSGNVLFRTAQTNPRILESRIDRMLSREYGLKGKTVVRSQPEMARLVKAMRTTWKSDPNWRYNVIFLRSPVDSKSVLDGITVKPKIENVTYWPGTLLWSARIDSLGRTAMLKLVARPIYQEMTVRNVNTTTKILEMMQRMESDVARH